MAEFNGWMCFGGNEISSWSRVNQNLRCEDRPADVGGCFPQIINDYSCPADYIDIEEDPAPWHDEDVPASYEFMGLYVHEVTGLDGPPFLRSSAVNNAIGGSLARLKYNGREMAVRGVMYATTCRGMDFGIRWLNQALLGAADCNGCPEDELIIRSCCPSESETDDDGLLTFKRTGVLNPPRYVKPIESCGCLVREVTWSFFSEIPYMFTKKLSTVSVTYNDAEDSCAPQWCSPCPADDTAPCAKDALPELSLSISATAPANNWYIGVPFSVGAEVYYDGFMYRAIVDTTGNQPNTSPTQWNQIDRVGTWSAIGGWFPRTGSFPSQDYYYTIDGTPNLSNTCYIVLREDYTYTADFDLELGVPTTCRILVQNSEKYTGCEDPVYDSIFESLIETDCACRPPFAVKKLTSIADNGSDWVDATTIIKITTGTDILRNLILEVLENPKYLDVYPEGDEDYWDCQDTCGGLSIPYLPANSVLTIDGLNRQITLKCGFNTQSGDKYVYSSDGTLFSWIDISCTPIILRSLAHPAFINNKTSIVVDIWERRI
jgi:hypothetical protein